MEPRDAAALTSIARAAMMCVTSADTGDTPAAQRALKRAQAQVAAVNKRWAPHARVRRLARKPVECAEAFLESAIQPKLDPEQLGWLYRATERAVQAVLAEAKPVPPAEKLTTGSPSA